MLVYMHLDVIGGAGLDYWLAGHLRGIGDVGFEVCGLAWEHGRLIRVVKITASRYGKGRRRPWSMGNCTSTSATMERVKYHDWKRGIAMRVGYE